MKPLVDQYREARARAGSDFEREVFDRAIKNGKIDPADYEESFNRYRQCATDAGLEATYSKRPNGIYQITPAANGGNKEAIDAMLDTMEQCARKSGLNTIEALYRTQVDNPELLADTKLLAVRCLIDAGLVASDYSVERLEALMKKGFSNNSDFDTANPDAQECLAAGGIAIKMAPGAGGDQGKNPNPIESGK